MLLELLVEFLLATRSILKTMIRFQMKKLYGRNLQESSNLINGKKWNATKVGLTIFL